MTEQCRLKKFPCSHDEEDPNCETPCKDVYSDKDCKCFITENTLPDSNGNYYERQGYAFYYYRNPSGYRSFKKY